MKKLLILLISISLIVLILLSCDTTKNSESQDVIVPESTEILKTNEANNSINQIDGDNIFVDGNSNLAEVEVGNIILSDACNAAPGGLLKRILSKTTVDDQVVFETEQASLAEAVQQLTLSASYQLTTDDVKNVQLFNGSKYTPKKNGLEFPIEIDCVLYDHDGNYSTIDDQILLSGDLLFTAELFTVIEISWFELTKFEIGIESDRNADLDLTANFHWEFEEELTLDIAQFNFSPITFMVGLVPVVIIPTLEVEAHVHGDLTVTFTTGITYTEQVRYGVGYENEEWYQINENEKSFDYSPPEFTTEFNFETGASLKLSTLIYGVGGPYVQAKAGLQFHSDLVINPYEMHLDFDLKAVLYALCGIYVEVLDHTLIDEYLEYILYTHLIGEWEIPINQAPNQPANPSPSDNASNVSINTNLSWSCSDPDDDQLTYDIYFGTNSTPPLLNTGQSSSNYDPGTMNEGITYFWKIIAKDDHDNSTTSEIWDFSTVDPPPDFITVSSPNGGETWEMGTSHNITWGDNISSNVKIELYKSGSYYETITSSTSSDGSYSWSIPTNLIESSSYKVKITSTSNSSVNDYSNNYFSIEDQPPADYITVSSPNGGETWEMGTSHNITWNDNISINVKIELYKSGSYYRTISSSTSSDGTYSWGIPTDLTESSSYKVKITSTSNSSVNDYSNNYFSIEDQPPADYVTISSPNGGETWEMGTTHNITWSDNISSNVKIELYKSGSYYRTITSSTSSDGTYSWNIPTNLTESSNYKVKIISTTNNSVSDYSDNSFTIEEKQGVPDIVMESADVDISLIVDWLDVRGTATIKNIGASAPSTYYDVVFYWSEDNILDNDDYIWGETGVFEIVLNHNEIYTIDILGSSPHYIIGTQYIIFHVINPWPNENDTLALPFSISKQSSSLNNSTKPFKENSDRKNKRNE